VFQAEHDRRGETGRTVRERYCKQQSTEGFGWLEKRKLTSGRTRGNGRENSSHSRAAGIHKKGATKKKEDEGRSTVTVHIGGAKSGLCAKLAPGTRLSKMIVKKRDPKPKNRLAAARAGLISWFKQTHRPRAQCQTSNSGETWEGDNHNNPRDGEVKLLVWGGATTTREERDGLLRNPRKGTPNP